MCADVTEIGIDANWARSRRPPQISDGEVGQPGTQRWNLSRFHVVAFGPWLAADVVHEPFLSSWPSRHVVSRCWRTFGSRHSMRRAEPWRHLRIQQFLRMHQFLRFDLPLRGWRLPADPGLPGCPVSKLVSQWRGVRSPTRRDLHVQPYLHSRRHWRARKLPSRPDLPDGLHLDQPQQEPLFDGELLAELCRHE